MRRGLGTARAEGSLRANVAFADGTRGHLWWRNGEVVADCDTPAVMAALEYLNGEPTLQIGEAPRENATCGYYEEKRKLLSEDEFLLVVGSLADVLGASVKLVDDRSDDQ